MHTCCVFVCCMYMSLLFSSLSAPLLCRCRKMSGPNKGGRAAHDPGVQGSAAAVPQNPDRSVGPGLAVPCRLHLAALLLLLLLLKGAGVCRPGGRPSKWRAGGLFGGRRGLGFIRGSDGLRDSRFLHAGSTETCPSLWRASSAAAGLQPLSARVLTSTYCLTHLLAMCWRLLRPLRPAAAARLLCAQLSTAQPYGIGPEGHYTTHPFAAQPYGPMPTYYSGQQQQQQPCPAYPVNGQTIGYPVNGTPPRPNGPGNVPVNSY